MHFSLQGIYVHPTNRRWCLYLSLAALLCIPVSIYGWIVHDPFLGRWAYITARFLMLVAMIVAVPQLLLPIALVLSPFMMAMGSLMHGGEIWTREWFWIGTGFCEVLGGWWLLRTIDRLKARYRASQVERSATPASASDSARQ